MINNESLFDFYVGNRRRGYRNAFSAPRWARVPAPAVRPALSLVLTAHGQAEPVETITETDMYDEERETYWNIGECGLCGEHVFVVDMTNGVCFPCERAEREDYEQTMRGVNAYLDYQQFSGLAAQFNSTRY